MLFDGGIRRGSDIFKVLVLGVDVVLVGRFYVFVLVIVGVIGVFVDFVQGYHEWC